MGSKPDERCPRPTPCDAHYCGWCCGCPVCVLADKLWQERHPVPTTRDDDPPHPGEATR